MEAWDACQVKQHVFHSPLRGKRGSPLLSAGISSGHQFQNSGILVIEICIHIYFSVLCGIVLVHIF